MNLVQELLGERSKAMCNRIVRYVGNNPARFNELVKVFLKGPYRVTQWSSWPLGYCVEKHPALIKPHLKQIIHNLEKPGLHDSVKRNTVRFLQFIEIPKSLQGVTTEICFRFLTDPKEPIAVKVFSMSTLANLAIEQPDLGKELKIVIEDQLPFASTGFAARTRKVLRMLK